MAYHGAAYPKVRRWLSFLEGKSALQQKWGLSLEETIRSLVLPHTGKVNKESIFDAEHAIVQEKVVLVQNLMRYESQKSRNVLATYLKRYEIRNLIHIVLALIHHRPITSLYDLGKGFRVQRPFVDDIRSLKDLQAFLVHTPYYRLAVDSFAELQSTGETLSFEIQLYNIFLEEMKGAVLGSGESSDWRETLVFGLEMERVLFVARMKFMYGLSLEELLAYFPLIFEGKVYWRNLMTAKDVRDFVRLLPKKLRLREVGDIQQLATALPQAVVSCLWPSMRYSGSVRYVGAFLIIQESMMQNWQIVLQGKRHRFDWGQVASFMVEGGRYGVF